jgi:hypothetical protein
MEAAGKVVSLASPIFTTSLLSSEHCAPGMERHDQDPYFPYPLELGVDKKLVPLA